MEKLSQEEGRLALVIHHKKANYGPLQAKIPVYVTFEPSAIRVELGDLEDQAFQAPDSARLKVLAAFEELAGKGTVVDLMEISGLAEGTVRNELSALKKAGRADHAGRMEEQS